MIKEKIKRVYRATKNIISKIKYKLKTYKLLIKPRTQYYLLGTPEYGNLGDHAIAYAEIEFIKKLGKTVTEITSEHIRKDYKGLKKVIKDNTIIITGGGFLGNLWMQEEKMIRIVLKEFCNNKIIIFPQTIYYTNDEKGYKEKEETMELYSKRINDIRFFARENNTYKFMKRELPKMELYLVPDIVLYIKPDIANEKREKILVTLRKDKESTNLSLIDKFIAENKDDIDYTDTIVNHNIKIKERKKELFSKLIEFKKAKIVITNRLHGMIFSVITGTPCICIDNLTKKISGVYEWVKDIEYIKMVNNDTQEEELKSFQEKVLRNKYNYNQKNMILNFQELMEVIKNEPREAN